MQILKIIGLASVFVWLLIPIRQFRTRFFLFFLVLGLLDPIALLWGMLLHYNIDAPYLFGTVLLFYLALFEVKKEIKIGLSLVLISATFIIVFYSISTSSIFQIIIHFIIFIYFLKVLVVYFSENRKLLLFHLFLVAYEFSLLLKFFVFYHELEIGLVYFYLTTGIQIIIGIFFLFVNELNSPKISI
jgi:hypothetical protein